MFWWSSKFDIFTENYYFKKDSLFETLIGFVITIKKHFFQILEPCDLDDIKLPGAVTLSISQGLINMPHGNGYFFLRIQMVGKISQLT